MAIRQPIITVAGHVDHGKTSILDCFRGSSVQKSESGGITQKISFTKYPADQIHKACPLIKEAKIDLKIPGFLFIDTPGHAAFTNLRKRGGSLADIAILVVDIKEGIKPQTIEVISILKANKTPFVIALNKVDTISGWQKKDSIKKSIEELPPHVKQEFDTALFTFQGAMQSHGFDPDLFYNITDFTKNIAIVPTSARIKEGISELLFVLAGLSEKFLGERLTLGNEAKGVLLEIKKDKAMEHIEAIIYDGKLKEGDEIAIATLHGNPIVGKVRMLDEIKPLSTKYESSKVVTAATGIRLQLTIKDGLLPGMPFRAVNKNIEDIKESFKKEIGETINLDKQGIIVKADSLGSLEALLTLLHQSNISVVKAGIGPITKTDIISGKANLEINPLDAIIIGFNVETEGELEYGNVKVLHDDVVYKLIEDLELWRKQKHDKIEKERMMGLATICKLELLPNFIFRNSNPSIFGVKITAGILKKHLPLIDDQDNSIASVKAVQSENHSVEEAQEGQEVALSLPGTNYERQLKNPGIKYLYSQLSETQFKKFRENKDLLTQNEIKTLQEIAEIKRRKNENWGI